MQFFNKKVMYLLVITFLLVIGIICYINHRNIEKKLSSLREVCLLVGKTYTISIKNNTFNPNTLTVNRCDKVVFINNDMHAIYLPAFGEHPHHVELPGFTEKVLGYQQINTFTAHIVGTFAFHDHLKDTAEGVLIVR